MATFTLSGSGTQALSNPASLAIVITAHSPLGQQGTANPPNWYHIGLLRLGTSHGYLDAVPLTATNQIIPCPAGASILGYWLRSGVTITVEERPERLLIGDPANPSSPAALPAEPDILSTVQTCAMGGAAVGLIFTRSAGSTFTANRALLVPFIINQSHTFSNMFYYAASGGGFNHQDVGIYTNTFSRVCSSGSTLTPTGGQSILPMSAAPITLSPGQYYFAFVCDSATPSFTGMSGPSSSLWLAGCKEMASAFPLPTTITPAVPAGTVIPHFGLSSKAII